VTSNAVAPPTPELTGESLRGIATLLEGREVECCVEGSSMGDTLPEGTRLRVRLSPASLVSPGAIVALVSGSRLVAHRLVGYVRRRGASYVITRGDAWLAPDPPVDSLALIGSVVGISNGEGWRPPPPERPRPLFDRMLARLCLSGVRALLLIDARLARWLSGRLHRVEAIAARLSLRDRRSS
jgi:hypothetical protein